MKFEEGKLDVLSKVFSSFRIEAGIAQRITPTARPTAMIPRPHHQSIIASGALFFGGVVAFECTKKVFRIEPTAHRHHRRLDVFKMRP